MGRSGNKSKASKTTSRSRNILLGDDLGVVQKTTKDDIFFSNQEDLIELLSGDHLWDLERFRGLLKSSATNFQGTIAQKRRLRKDPVLKALFKFNLDRLRDGNGLSQGLDVGQIDVKYRELFDDEVERFIAGDRHSMPSLFEVFALGEEALGDPGLYNRVEKDFLDQMNKAKEEGVFDKWLPWYLEALKQSRYQGDGNYFFVEEEPLPAEEDVVEESLSFLSDGIDPETANQIIFDRVSSNDPSHYKREGLPPRLLKENLSRRIWRQAASEISESAEEPIDVLKMIVNEESNKEVASHVLSVLEGEYSEERDLVPLRVRVAELMAISPSASLFEKLEVLIGTDDDRRVFEKAKKEGYLKPEKIMAGHLALADLLSDGASKARSSDDFSIVKEIIGNIRSIVV